VKGLYTRCRNFQITRGPGPRLEVGFAAHLFFDHMPTPSEQIETRLAEAEPDVEVLAVEQIAAERLRIVIDRDGGVDLALCERVTRHLRDLLLDYALEVSSPGPERPLVKPEHFRRYLGRRARVRTREPRDGHKSFTGELVGASDEEVTVAAASGVVTIPYSEINRSNLVEEGR
jgi:ribosome maturation factor RimP